MTQSTLRNDALAVRVLASEGAYHIYRQLAARRLFVAAKLGHVAYRYWRGTGTRPAGKRIALIKGANQLRHHRHCAEMRAAQLGEVAAFADYDRSAALPTLPRIKTAAFLLLVLLVLRVVLLGRRRDLSLYLLAFFRAVRTMVQEDLSDLEVLVCYNDQPFDVAALVHALDQKGGCRTIVIQHGLILSPKFYFPAIAREFWAWGVLSQDHFATRHPEGRLIVTGRYHADAALKSARFADTAQAAQIRTLIAFSFSHDEISQGLNEISRQRRQLSDDMVNRLQFDIKLHPALKNGRRIRAMIANGFPWITIVDGDMEELANRYDNLITGDSTSAVQFLLLGKSVYFLAPHETADFPSKDYGFALGEFPVTDADALAKRNDMRLDFLKQALHV